MVYPYNGIVYSSEYQKSTATCINLDDAQYNSIDLEIINYYKINKIYYKINK